MIPLPISPTLIAALAAAAVIAGLSGAVYVQTERLGAVTAKFDKFKADTKAAGDAAQKAANDDAERRKFIIDQKDKDNVAAQTAIRRRYDAFIASLRNDSAGSNPSAAPAIHAGVCTNDDGNDRLSDALLRFNAGTAKLLETAEQQASALVTLRESWPTASR